MGKHVWQDYVNDCLGYNAVCNNRANRHNSEPFTGLQLCQSCDPVYVPKISFQRIKILFRPNLPPKYTLQMPPSHMTLKSDDNMNAVTFQDQVHGPCYLWADVLGGGPSQRRYYRKKILQERTISLVTPPTTAMNTVVSSLQMRNTMTKDIGLNNCCCLRVTSTVI